MFYCLVMREQVEHWFNRQWKWARRDVYLHRDGQRWYVEACRGSTDRRTTVTHDFGDEAQARQMVQHLLTAAPEGQGDWAMMPSPRRVT